MLRFYFWLSLLLVGAEGVSLLPASNRVTLVVLRFVDWHFSLVRRVSIIYSHTPSRGACILGTRPGMAIITMETVCRPCVWILTKPTHSLFSTLTSQLGLKNGKNFMGPNHKNMTCLKFKIRKRRKMTRLWSFFLFYEF